MCGQALALLLLIAGIGAFFVFALDRTFSFGRLVASRAALRETVDAHALGALALYAALYITIAALSVPGGLVLTLAGGFLFGALVGGATAAASAVAGGTILFLAAKTVLNDALARKAGGIVGRIRRGFQQSAWSYLLFLRLSPVFPFWLVNIGAALAGVPLATFAWTTALGILPMTFVVAAAGANLDRVAGASADALEACRATGESACRTGLPFREIVSPSAAGLLIGASLLALTPALLSAWRRRRHGGARDEPDAGD